MQSRRGFSDCPLWCSTAGRRGAPMVGFFVLPLQQQTLRAWLWSLERQETRERVAEMRRPEKKKQEEGAPATFEFRRCRLRFPSSAATDAGSDPTGGRRLLFRQDGKEVRVWVLAGNREGGGGASLGFHECVCRVKEMRGGRASNWIPMLSHPQT